MMPKSASATQNVFSFFGSSSASKSRPGTSSGESSQPQQQPQQQQQAPFLLQQPQPDATTKDRKGSFPRKASISSPTKQHKKRGTSFGSLGARSSGGSGGSGGGGGFVTDSSAPPALPDYALTSAARIAREGDTVTSPESGDGFPRMTGRAAPAPTPVGYSSRVSTPLPPPGTVWQGEAAAMHKNMREIVRKRMYTLDYLRKAHEGPLFWFNTYMLNKPNQNRTPPAMAQKLARRATNYLLLGLSLPPIIDLVSPPPLEFFRNLNALLSEFESFQQLHGDPGSSTSLSRARLPQMFRRGAGARGRRPSAANDTGYPAGETDGGLAAAAVPPSVVNFAGAEAELLPGEAYTHLLTPALPFDPDFHETFATLCDALIECYGRMLGLVPTPGEFSAPVAEQFAKADARVRKLVIQGAVKEFEESTKAHLRAELGNINKVVLGGLM